jgi:iron complex outermembrane receptor protein
VTNEIVAKLVDRQSTFENAGETAKLGAEVSAAFSLLPGLDLGAGYAWSDFTYRDYAELVSCRYLSPAEYPQCPAAGQVSIPRDGNRLQYVPQHQWSAFASWKGPAGLRARVQTNTWGRYHLDAANTETYRGYRFLTNVGIGWTRGSHELLLDAQNVLDSRHAMAVTKDASGKVTYTAATPRSVMLGYRLAFGGGRP